ncbi:hypothetical protein [Elizabethkingia meningoseptica]|uniref:hypothetical protein n=1 Tax=Elizabethkingia meningoseptica TaxID=238 RepID=UPI001629667E|nr:hypothetical protein [Elizabethkingia meningoseptica]MBG0514070.1 hypothetical protein [Elizabethkingia meningoseptica]
MKRLEEIQNEYAIKCGFENWETLVVQTSLRTGSSIGKITQIENYHKEIAKLYAREVAQASLQKAAENANMKVVTLGIEDCSQMTKSFYHKPSATEISLNKSSITNESNIVIL